MTHNALHRNEKNDHYVWTQFTLPVLRLEMIDYVRGPFNHNILLDVIKGDTCIVWFEFNFLWITNISKYGGK